MNDRQTQFQNSLPKKLKIKAITCNKETTTKTQIIRNASSHGGNPLQTLIVPLTIMTITQKLHFYAQNTTQKRKTKLRVCRW